MHAHIYYEKSLFVGLDRCTLTRKVARKQQDDILYNAFKEMY